MFKVEPFRTAITALPYGPAISSKAEVAEWYIKTIDFPRLPCYFATQFATQKNSKREHKRTIQGLSLLDDLVVMLVVTGDNGEIISL
ncbi:hypothetical protein E4633_17085 [Geomonas terrae]|uniref:Uncharacterized protein n=1 Tax=Geomonas terrae TaxID=2562681 RepID=A0A4S1CC34_9BACT|nr:hypothetical protein [Geomonas terrae]TGU70713.1 hypothetical protein E4633_17085 [Geomonas terrae]